MSNCRILAGEVFVQDLGVADQPLLSIGNAQLSLAITEEEQTLPDYTSLAGGNACSIKTIAGVELTGTLYDFRVSNLALAVFGEASSAVAGNVTAEALDAFTDGALNLLEHIPTAGTVDVKIGLTTYTEDTDYTVTKGGFVVIDGSALDTAILAGTGTPKHVAVTVDYSYGAEDLVEALTASGKTFRVVVQGRNRADGGKGEMWDFYQAQFGPVGGINIISREFGSYELKAEVIADTTKPPGETQYFRVWKEA